MSASVGTAYDHLHDDAVRVLRAWAAPDRAQDALRQAYLEHLAAHPDGVAKAGPPEHLTASVIVFDRTGTQVLLTHHRKARAWLQFGGHLEAQDPSVYAAAVREVGEESGVAGIQVIEAVAELNRHVLRGDFGRCREHLDVRYVGVAPDGPDGRPLAPIVSAESLDVRWWPVAALPGESAAELAGLITAGRRLLAAATPRLSPESST